MIRKPEECTKQYVEHMRGGDGTVEITHFATTEELYNKGRLFGKVTLQPGCGIGYHVHEQDSELIYVMKGEAVYNDAGIERAVSAGDVLICPEGTGHGICNKSDSVVELCAVIVYA